MKKKTEAKCSRKMLTVAFHSADPPLIWRFDLERNHSFTLSLQGEEGDWELGVTTPKGDFYPIAHFAERETGEEALNEIETILNREKGFLWPLIKFLMLVGILTTLGFGGLSALKRYFNHPPLTPVAIAPPLPAPTIQPAPDLPPASPPEEKPAAPENKPETK